jgi:hypothetical protein
VAIETSCCGTCGVPELPAFAGVNENYVQNYRAEKCPAPYACPALACLTAENPNIAARCTMGHCEAFDVRKVAAYSACQLDTDCALRAGLGCCECGATTWVAVSHSGEQAIPAAECAPNAACADCLPVPPINARAICQSNVCQLVYLR